METLLCDVRDETAYITLNRPQVLNALNAEVYQELGQVLKSVYSDRTVRVVIITGAGDRAFAAGADIGTLQGLAVQEARSFAREAKRAVDMIADLPQPVIAAVNGLALGGGCELAMACDMRIASTRARFGQPEINLAIIPGGGGTQRLPRLVGVTRAKQMIFTGAVITAEEALSIGLVNEVVEPEELLPAAERMAATLRRKGPISLALAKAALNRALDLPMNTGLDYEIECFSECFGTRDQKEGMAAFVDKRLAEFRGQ